MAASRTLFGLDEEPRHGVELTIGFADPVRQINDRDQPEDDDDAEPGDQRRADAETPATGRALARKSPGERCSYSCHAWILPGAASNASCHFAPAIPCPPDGAEPRYPVL